MNNIKFSSYRLLYNFTNDPKYGTPFEDAFHYLMECPLY